jgi:excisionase family DNA binding protein
LRSIEVFWDAEKPVETMTNGVEQKPSVDGRQIGEGRPIGDGPAWLDVKAAAARVLVSESTILREARRGRLVGYKVGGRKCWRFRSADVDDWLMQSVTPSCAVQR